MVGGTCPHRDERHRVARTLDFYPEAAIVFGGPQSANDTEPAPAIGLPPATKKPTIPAIYGNPETTPGGRALKFFSSVRMEVRRVETLKQGSDQIGIRARVKVIKNKVAPPFRQAEFDIMFNGGISRSGGILDMGTDLGIVTKSGTWFTYGDRRLGQGRENAKQHLEENPEVMREIEQRIREQAVGTPISPGSDGDQEEK